MIGVVAGIALIRFKVGVIPVVLVAGPVGIAATLPRGRLLLACAAREKKKARTDPGLSGRTA